MTGRHRPLAVRRRPAVVACGTLLVAVIALVFASSASGQRASLDRPLHLPRLENGARCPVSPGDLASTLGRGLARMPVTRAGLVHLMSVGDDPAGSVGVGRPDLQGWRGQKAPWIASPRYRGPILIRGARLDGSGQVRFARSTGDRLQALYLRRGQGVQPNGWRVWPATLLVRSPGCYALQVDGTTFSDVIVIRVHVLPPWPYY